MKTRNLAVLTLITAFAACGGGGGGSHHGGGGGGGYVPPPVDPGPIDPGPIDPGPTLTSGEAFVDNLNYDDPLETYYLAKDEPESLEIGHIIVEEGNGTYWGVDIESSARFDFYDYDLDYYLDAAFQVFYVEGNLYEDVYGNLYEKTTEVSKDLLKVQAVLGKARAKDIGEQLAANYGLSEERGIELGKMLVNYKDLKKTRAISAKEEDSFAKSVFGSKVSDMAKALEKHNAGDAKDMDAMIETAAQVNGTTPEHVRELFSSVLAK